MAARTVAILFEVLSMEHGIWCDSCALSSAHRVWFTVTTNGRVQMKSKVVCEGC